jgi:beta-galactosidase
MLPVLADGVRLWPGGRQHYCPSSQTYRDAARRLVEAMAGRYAGHPALVAWHCGNEYGCHVPACYCDASASHFRGWLQRRYQSLRELNDAWGTAFWSQHYSDWSEVLPPRRAPTFPNPTQQLDFNRFCSDALLECFEAERAVLAELSPGVPVTTNFMRFFKPLDYWRWAEREDFVSNDSYPDPLDPDAGVGAAMAGDLMRSLGRGRPWIQMEQTTNRVNWREVNAAKAPGQMRLWSLQAVAHGADGILFFQWRQSRAGAEKFHSAMVPHAGVEADPTWRDVVGLGAELRRLDAVCGSRVQADVAILLDWESWWALELPSKPSSDLNQLDQLESFYRPLFAANVTTDFARPGDDLSGYKLVVVPSLYLVSDEGAAGLTAFVDAGGTMVMSFFSGIVDVNEHIRLPGYAAPFREALGLSVIDFLPVAPGETVGVQFGDGAAAAGRLWSERVAVDGAEVLAIFSGGALDGQPAVTRHGFGRGAAYYLATSLEPSALAEVLGRARVEAGVEPVAPAGVEAIRRTSEQDSLLFLLNHGDHPVEADLPRPGVELLSGERAPGPTIRLAPRDVAIVREA